MRGISQAFFNELSQSPFPDSEAGLNRMLRTFFELLQEVSRRGVKKFWVGELEYCQWRIFENKTLQEVISGPQYKNYQDFFYSHFSCPNVGDDDVVVKRIVDARPQMQYQGGIVPCLGLGAAYFYKSFAVNMDSEECWHRISYPIIVDDERQVESVALTCKEDVWGERFEDWMRRTFPSEIQVSTLDFKEKPFRLSGDHHGKKELQRLWNKIGHKRYITGVLCSIENHSNARDSILRVYDNGTIDVVDVRSDSGYAMKVETTARDRYEAERVADMIREWLS